MPQFLRPIADIDLGSWSDQGGNTTDIYRSIDEPSASDGDFVGEGGGIFSAFPYTIELTTGVNPGVTSGHQLHVRACAMSDGVHSPLTTMTVELQDTHGGGTITTASLTGLVVGSFQDYTVNLTGPEAAAIVDYAELRLVFGGVLCRVSQAYLQIPDAGFGNHLDTSGPGAITAAAGSGHYLASSGPGTVRVAGTEGSSALLTSGPGTVEHG